MLFFMNLEMWPNLWDSLNYCFLFVTNNLDLWQVLECIINSDMTICYFLWFFEMSMNLWHSLNCSFSFCHWKFDSLKSLRMQSELDLICYFLWIFQMRTSRTSWNILLYFCPEKIDSLTNFRVKKTEFEYSWTVASLFVTKYLTPLQVLGCTLNSFLYVIF